MKLSLEDKLELYRGMKIDLANLKSAEMDLRVDIATELSKEGLSAGTHTFDEFEGMTVKIASKLNYSLDKEALEGVMLEEAEEACIRWKPELNLKAYKALVDKDNLDTIITVKPGAPTLTVELSE